MTACCPSPAGRNRRRGARVLSWSIPTLTLVLAPKCPLCLAAWIALVTGIALSPSIAAGLRAALLLASAIMLARLTVQHLFPPTAAMQDKEAQE